MQKRTMRLIHRQILFVIFLCVLVTYLIARPWTPFWVDITVGVIALAVVLWEIVKSKKSK